MLITLCLLIGTIFLGLFFYNKFFYVAPKIPNAIKATVINCEYSQSRVAQKLRKDKAGIDLYDITYEWKDKNGEMMQAMETVRYREDVGTVKDMIIERKPNGHQELVEIDVAKPHHIWFYLAMSMMSYAAIGFIYIMDTNPQFLTNLKGYGFFILLAFAFITISMFLLERYHMQNSFIENPKQVGIYDAEIFKYKKFVTGKRISYSPIYRYELNGKNQIYESTNRYKKMKPMGTRERIYIDLLTSKQLSLSKTKSFLHAGVASAVTGGVTLLLYIVLAAMK